MYRQSRVTVPKEQSISSNGQGNLFSTPPHPPRGVVGTCLGTAAEHLSTHCCLDLLLSIRGLLGSGPPWDLGGLM
jgi:hypothetical protein